MKQTKKMKTVIGALMVFVLVAQAFVSPLSYMGESNAAATFEKKAVPAYIRTMDNKTTIDCLFYSDNPSVAYMDPVDYIKPLFTDGIPVSEKKNADGTFTITKEGSDMIVDPAADTVKFNCYEDFTIYKAYAPPMSTGGDPYYKEGPSEVPASPATVTLQLAPYKIDIREEGGKVYLPMPTLADMFCCNYNVGLYRNGSIYFEYVMNPTSLVDRTDLYNTMDRDPALIDYTYNELCFLMDHFYGKPHKAAGAAALTEKGFDKFLDTYSDESRAAKQYLKSPNQWDFLAGMSSLQQFFQDGGHSSFVFEIGNLIPTLYPDSLVCKTLMKYLTDPEAAKTATGSSLALISGIALSAKELEQKNANLIAADRSQAYPAYQNVKTWTSEESGTQMLLRDGDTVVFVFDHFQDDVVAKFKWSLDYAKQEGIKNFIIDLTLNGGGSTGVLSYIMTVITNNKYHTNKYTLKTVCTLSGNITAETSELDLNLDGKINDEDKDVAYDFNYGILESRYSFSCGNLLPILAQEEGIAILGEASGGGECEVTRYYTPETHEVSLSMMRKFYRKDERPVDDGAVPDYPLLKTKTDAQTGAETADYSGFYNIPELSKMLEKHYDGKKDNTLKVTAGKAAVKAAQLVAGKQSVKALKIKKAKGPVTVKVVKKGTSSKIYKNVSVNKKGVIILKKGKYKKGTYKIVILVSAAGNAKYYSAEVTKTVKMKIK